MNNTNLSILSDYKSQSHTASKLIEIVVGCKIMGSHDTSQSCQPALWPPKTVLLIWVFQKPQIKTLLWTFFFMSMPLWFCFWPSAVVVFMFVALVLFVYRLLTFSCQYVCNHVSSSVLAQLVLFVFIEVLFSFYHVICDFYDLFNVSMLSL